MRKKIENMNKIAEVFKILSEEHQNILKVVEHLEKKCDLYNSGEEINYDFIEDVLDFIVNYADKFHHAKEEELLFKEFQKAINSGSTHCNPLEQMYHEHDVGRGYVTEIKKGLSEKNEKKIISNARDYINLIRDHIFKEDNILYPMADETLTKEVKKTMLNKFKDINKINEDNKKKYIDFIRRLQNV
jgi:hemerythrin-like domain-containing protein